METENTWKNHLKYYEEKVWPKIHQAMEKAIELGEFPAERREEVKALCDASCGKTAATFVDR